MATNISDMVTQTEIFGYVFNKDGFKMNPIEFDTMTILYLAGSIFIAVLLAMLTMYLITKGATS